MKKDRSKQITKSSIGFLGACASARCVVVSEPRIVMPDGEANEVCARVRLHLFPRAEAGRRMYRRRRRSDSTAATRHRAFDRQMDFPGGFVDLGETPAKCAVRETFEEIGMMVAARPPVRIYADRNDPIPIIVVTYLSTPGIETPAITPRRPRSVTSASMRFHGANSHSTLQYKQWKIGSPLFAKSLT